MLHFSDFKVTGSGTTASVDIENVKLVWEGSDPDTETSNLKYTVYFDATDGKQDPSDDRKDLTSQELEVSVEAGVYCGELKQQTEVT